jgi:N-acetyl-alpha-D-glucosaminyl L-malate synthase BshA
MTGGSATEDGRLCIGVLCHPTYGGSGVVATELALSMARKGHEVHVFSHEVPPRLARSSGPVEMHVARGFPYPLFTSTPHDLAVTSKVLEIHRLRGLDLLHAHYALPHAVSAFLAREASRHYHEHAPPRVVTTLHGTDITLVGNDPAYAPLTEHALRASDAVTAVSEDLARRTRESFCVEEAACPIEVIPNFVDCDLFAPSESTRPSRPTLVHVSNFRPVKRVPWLVRAFALAAHDRDAQLVLVGDGPDQAECRRVAAEGGVADRVVFLGERDALPGLLSPASAFCLTSREESFGLSALEAMACGTPVIATRVGGVSEVVEDGVSGMLCAAEDLEGYASLLRRALVDQELVARMGAAARTRAVDHFSFERVLPRYEALYRRVLAQP